MRIGLIADVQYADIDDVWNFMKTHKRGYRNTLIALRNAVEWWNKSDISLVVDLGDAIDGIKNTNREMAMHALHAVMAEWQKIKLPVLHLIGNHELYRFSRTELLQGIPVSENNAFSCAAPRSIKTHNASRCMYYTFKPDEKRCWRFVVLDPYDMAVIRNGAGDVHPEHTQICQSNNPNNILHASNFFEGLSGLESRWSPFNGGVGNEQIEWLENVLVSAHKNGEKLLVLSHVILHPNATPNGDCHTLLWNYDIVLDLFKKYTPCVQLVISGHAHQTGYFRCIDTGIHHIALASPLEAPPGVSENTFGLLEISDDDKTAIIIGKGAVESLTMNLGSHV